jgi:hypothetical protein
MQPHLKAHTGQPGFRDDDKCEAAGADLWVFMENSVRLGVSLLGRRENLNLGQPVLNYVVECSYRREIASLVGHDVRMLKRGCMKIS